MSIQVLLLLIKPLRTNVFLSSASIYIPYKNKGKIPMKFFVHKFNQFLSLPVGMGHIILLSQRQRNQVNVQDIRFVIPVPNVPIPKVT